MPTLVQVPANFVDFEWQKGAHRLSEACDFSDSEITGDQLKMLISRGERILLQLVEDDGAVSGWSVVRIDQLPNVRVFFVCDVVGKGVSRFVPEARKLAYSLGCSQVRCAAKPAHERLYKRFGFRPVYQILGMGVL